MPIATHDPVISERDGSFAVSNPARSAVRDLGWPTQGDFGSLPAAAALSSIEPTGNSVIAPIVQNRTIHIADTDCVVTIDLVERIAAIISPPLRRCSWSRQTV
jgi:hypothetical protein